MYLNSLNKYECCGCSACEQICPKSCISLKKDEEGFLYPEKDASTCIDCGLCEKVCPFSDNYTETINTDPEVYAAYDESSRTRSSSGGVFYTLAKYVIEEKRGWVFGAAFADHFQLQHIGVNNMQDVEKLRGSKYLQSKMGDTFLQIKKLLTDGVFVLFVGTPCQVAGLRAFLRKPFDNLFTADLVCHGTPSQQMFDYHINYLERKHKAKLTSYKFRYEDGWGVCEICDFANPEKHKMLPTYELSPYLYSFMYALTYRYSCYNCCFAKIPRQGDITLADYWGVKEFFPQVNAEKGVSLVLINSQHGLDIWNAVESQCISYKSNIADAAKYNGNLIKKSVEPAIRKTVYSRVANEGYDSLAKREFRSPNYLKTRLITCILHCNLFKPAIIIYRKIKK